MSNLTIEQRILRIEAALGLGDSVTPAAASEAVPHNPPQRSLFVPSRLPRFVEQYARETVEKRRPVELLRLMARLVDRATRRWRWLLAHHLQRLSYRIIKLECGCGRAPQMCRCSQAALNPTPRRVQYMGRQLDLDRPVQNAKYGRFIKVDDGRSVVWMNN